jgi:hypothetical protein
VHIGNVNKKKGHLVSACLTWAARAANQMEVRGPSRALEVAGEGRNRRSTTLEGSLEPKTVGQRLLSLASAARLSSCSWPAPSPKSCSARAVYCKVSAVQALKVDQDINQTIGGFYEH